MSERKFGRPSVFRGKNPKHVVHGLLTNAGKKAFEGHRKDLGKLAGLPAAKVSDSDTIEYLARGQDVTIAVIGK